MQNLPRKLLIFSGYLVATIVDAMIDTMGILAAFILVTLLITFFKSILRSPTLQQEKFYANDIVLQRYIESSHDRKELELDEQDKNTVEIRGTVIKTGSGIPQF